eukprot:403373804
MESQLISGIDNLRLYQVTGFYTSILSAMGNFAEIVYYAPVVWKDAFQVIQKNEQLVQYQFTGESLGKIYQVGVLLNSAVNIVLNFLITYYTAQGSLDALVKYPNLYMNSLQIVSISAIVGVGFVFFPLFYYLLLTENPSSFTSVFDMFLKATLPILLNVPSMGAFMLYTHEMFY